MMRIVKPDEVDRLRLDAIIHHFDCGVALMRCNRHAQALVEFETVLRIDPSHSFARWNRSLALLAMGDYERGWPEHRSMWQIFDWRNLAPAGDIDVLMRLPVWGGQRCRLIVFHEMGFGDAIMCLRFVPALVRCCESVTLVAKPELVELMSGYGATVVGAVPDDLSGFDAQVPLFDSICFL